MSYETIILKKEDYIATLTLNRPEKLNALSLKAFEELEDAIERVRQDDDIRVLVITGAGRAFCSGADIAATPGGSTIRSPEEMKEVNRQVHRKIVKLRNLPKPVIASINGLAVGGGLELALLADIRIASEKAKFSEIYVKRGLVPDMGGTYILPRLVGISKACELIFTGDMIDAEEAKRIGLVSRVVPPEELESATKELATKLAKGPPIAIRLAKLSIYRGLNMDFESELEFEAYAQTICHLTEDHQEGIRAFLEKREPVFKGR